MGREAGLNLEELRRLLLLEPVDREGPIPLHMQIRERLLKAIQASHMPSHRRLPSERLLAEWFGVNRLTVRQAVQELIRQGYLYARPGKGTFVARARMHQPLQWLTSFTEDMAARGMKASSRLLSQEILPAPPDIAQRLNVAPGTEVVRLERLRLADEEPMALETAYLPHSRCPGLLSFDFSQLSLYEVLRKHYGLRLQRAEQTIQAVVLSPKEARWFGLPRGSPGFLLERITFLENDEVIEFVRSLYRGDRYQFQVQLIAPK
ncbi:GntR family transcriptional regulator [Thermoflexus sp.]|uniref:GntR family transcriptional regulator n=1 Tax=Thermoflexus sp. TaxID=1969742 RepID=UPI0026148FC2|nr:GntR family transcriptional regulator [Thermoflexus sp.]MCS6962632.1 GntR family transcriptional regulator [Thermoflexus sp.]MCX7689990.1 GntR family transcriptional regulator [Thermoflexus sp.]MDW8185783.1 GntR family transcriptional regulator [Anaerolineae bacterium]